MNEINEVLRNNNIKPLGYKKCGNVIRVKTNNNDFVVKKNNVNDKIFEYLNNCNFKEYPDTIFNKNYIITKYEEDSSVPSERKIVDLIETIGILHNKTSFYKEVSNYDYKTIYEDLIRKLDYLYNYYDSFIRIIDDKIIYSPSEFLLARNISYIFKSINNSKNYINDWYKKIENINKARVSVIHNNLDLSHFIKNKRNYLISWDNSKIDMPIYDLYTLYNKYYLDYNFNELLKRYEKIYPLKDYEKELLLVLINVPKKIEKDTEYNMCKNISNEVDRLYKSNELLEQYKNSLAKN